MQDDMTHLEVATDDREAFVLCLALGTLEAIRSGLWPLDSGIWAMGRPVFWKPLVLAGIPTDVLEVLQGADELDTLCKLAGRSEADVALDRMIHTVSARLAALPEKSWYARWAVGERKS